MHNVSTTPFAIIVARYLTVLAAHVMLWGCHKKEGNNSLSVSADYLYVSGRAVVSTNKTAGLANTTMYLGHDGISAATTDSEGHFGFTINETDLQSLSESETKLLGDRATGTFQIYLDSRNPAFFGVSRPIKFSDRGSIDLGSIELSTGATITGMVQKYPADGSFLPVAGVKVQAGNKWTTTGADGEFTLKHVAANEVKVLAGADAFAAAQTIVHPKSGETTKLNYPLVLFPGDVVNGWVTVLPRGATKDLVAAGHPYQRSFMISTAPRVRYMRFHHERKIIDDNNDGSLWRDVSERLNYDFPGNGGHNLYIQFADAHKKSLSSVLTVQAPIDIFDDTTGIVIGTGSGIITSRIADIHISVPRAATKMRLSEDINNLSQTLVPFRPVSSIVEFIFQRQPDLGDNRVARPAGKRVSIYVQFSDNQNNLSSIYNASAILNLFPEPATDMFKIENGAATTQNRLVHLDIKIPKNAHEMRVFEASASGASSVSIAATDPSRLWVGAHSTFFFTFGSAGLKQLFLQFRTIDGEESSFYSSSILVQPFAPGDIGFTINAGSPTTPVRDVTLTLVPPPGAVAFRFAEGAAPGATSEDSDLEWGWITLTPHIAHSLTGRGLRTIYLEYLDANNNRSPLYSQSISVELFGGFPGTLAINGGQIFTDYPTLSLAIQPPLDAVEMLITENPNTSYFEGEFRDCHLDSFGWQAVATQASYTVSNQGPKTIYVKFRNATCDETGFIQQSIVYQAFPSILEQADISVVGNPQVVYSRFIQIVLNIPPRAQYMVISATPIVSGNNNSGGLGGLLGGGGSGSVSLCSISSVQSRAIPATNPALINFELPDNDGSYRIYVRYAANDPDDECVTSAEYFSLPVYLRRFPSAMLGMSINGGAATTTDPRVTLSLATPPPDAVAVLLAESLEDLEEAVSHPLNAQISFTLSADIGQKTVWAQYITSRGQTSPAFSAAIMLDTVPTPTASPSPTPTL